MIVTMIKQKTVSSSAYEWLAAAFVMVLIVSNIASVKIVEIGSIVFDAGTILFPISYIIGDVVAEVYGFRRMRGLLLRGVTFLLLTSVVFWAVGLLPSTGDWGMQAQYTDILGTVGRIIFASITAIFVGELINAYVLAKMKIADKGARLWNRIIASSAVGNALDTVLFSVIAFAGTMPSDTLIQLIVSVYLIKMTVEILLSPLTMKVIAYVKKHENTDVYEKPSLV